MVNIRLANLGVRFANFLRKLLKNKKYKMRMVGPGGLEQPF
jgi:hypothetical protein